MSERARLIRKWKSGLYEIQALADQFTVSRPTVYERIHRYEEEGDAGLIDRPSIPKSCPHRTPTEIAERIVAAKREHPHWGPRKLIDLLRIETPEVAWPAASTAGEILDREGLVKRRPKRRGDDSRPTGQRLRAAQSGEMMTVDHKGQFRMGNGEYCFPVTINDPVSRFIYAIDGARSTSRDPVRNSFETVFREHGIPEFVGSDNGNPFSCNRALGGLSELAVWWIKLGIRPVRIHPGCPWENGAHERMHKTLKAETTQPPHHNLRTQQARFDAFRLEFNHVRPHDSLLGRRPAEVLKQCRRPYPRRLAAIEYPGHYETRSVRTNGAIKWKSEFLFVSETLAGERVGLIEIDDGIWSLNFSMIELGRYDERTKRIW